MVLVLLGVLRLWRYLELKRIGVNYLQLYILTGVLAIRCATSTTVAILTCALSSGNMTMTLKAPVWLFIQIVLSVAGMPSELITAGHDRNSPSSRVSVTLEWAFVKVASEGHALLL